MTRIQLEQRSRHEYALVVKHHPHLNPEIFEGKRGAPRLRAELEARVFKMLELKAKMRQPQKEESVAPEVNKMYRTNGFIDRMKHPNEKITLEIAIERAILARQSNNATLRKTRVGFENLEGGNAFQYAQIGDWIITSSENRDVDWNYYAKSYCHPKVTVSDRKVRFDNVKTQETKTLNLSGWRGNWILNSMLEGILEKKAGLMNIRLHGAFDVTLVRSIGSVKIYERTLCGDHEDFCAVALSGTTYHSDSMISAVRGLREKILATGRAKRADLITWKLCKSLGFCSEGLNNFIRDFNLEHDNYLPLELEKIVRTNIERAAPYISELKTLARAVGLNVPEFVRS
jgi:hypothetical protein